MNDKKTFLVLGTTSGCGKSFTTTTLLRFLLKKGYRVAPFKAYNFSSKYHDFGDGRKQSYSTYFQSLAAETVFRPEMNPVYVQPVKSGVEVYINGNLYDHVTYGEYDTLYPMLEKKSLESFVRLRTDYDVIVMEGSGSPAEINCFDHDLANRFMAESVRPTSILVGNIDPGGVFAALHGTLELMPPGVRDTVGGFIINQYSGAPETLKKGVDILEMRHGIPCLGIMPKVVSDSFDIHDPSSRQHYFEEIETLSEQYCCFEKL